MNFVVTVMWLSVFSEFKQKDVSDRRKLLGLTPHFGQKFAVLKVPCMPPFIVCPLHASFVRLQGFTVLSGLVNGHMPDVSNNFEFFRIISPGQITTTNGQTLLQKLAINTTCSAFLEKGIDGSSKISEIGD